MFGRATIRLGIGPHSSLIFFSFSFFYDSSIQNVSLNITRTFLNMQQVKLLLNMQLSTYYSKSQSSSVIQVTLMTLLSYISLN